MKLNQEQLRAANLWRVAEGRPNSAGQRPTAAEQRRAQFAMSESIAQGDFPVAILPAVRETTQRVYATVESQAGAFTTRKTVQALNIAEELRVYTFGDQTNLQGLSMGDEFVNGGLPTLGPRERYPQIGLTATSKKIIARKLGEAFSLDWEEIVARRGSNVDLIRDAFEAFGENAKNQEDIDVAKLLVAPTGFRTASGQALETAKPATAANGFSVNNADLSNPEDFAALVALANRAVLTVGTGGTTYQQPVSYGNFVLLTTPERAPRVRQALAARRITRSRGSAGGTEWEETIDYGAEITVIGWEWLRRIWGSMGKGWIAVPTVGPRDLPILTSNYLAGYETPQVFVRDSNSRRVGGGGEVDPRVDGDFDSDAVITKVRHAHGADFAWMDGVVYSTGANA